MSFFASAGVVALSLMITVVVAPKPTALVDFRTIERPISITIDKTSPAYAALEDLRLSLNKESKSINNQNSYEGSEDLFAGVNFNVQPNTFKDFEAEPLLAEVSPQKTPQAHSLKLNGLRISIKDDENIKEEIKEARLNLQLYYPDGTLRPIEERKQILLTSYSRGQTPFLTLRDKAEKLINKNKQRGSQIEKIVNSEDRVKTLPTTSGGVIHVAALVNTEGSKDSGTQGFHGTHGSRATRAPVNENFPNIKVPSIHPPNIHPPRPDGPELASATLPQPSQRDALSTASLVGSSYSEKISLSGRIQFKDGAAFAAGDHELRVYHIFEGIVLSEGFAWPQKGLYRVEVEGLRGVIVAENRTRTGELLSKGELNLYEVEKNLESTALSIEVKPIFEGIIAEVRDVSKAWGDNSELGRLKDAEVYVADLNEKLSYNFKEKAYLDNEIIPPSETILRVEAEGYKKSLVVAESGKRQVLNLYPKKMIHSVLEALFDRRYVSELLNKGMIWGRILKDGHPVENAEVKLPFSDEHRPTYFSGVIPDRKLTRTSRNGQFFLAGLNYNLELVEVNIEGESVNPVFVPVIEGGVSPLDIEVFKPREVELTSYEMFTNRLVDSDVKVLGNEKVYRSSVNESIKHTMASNSGLSYLEVDGGDVYELTRVRFKRQAYEVQIPLFKKAWVDKFFEKVNQEPTWHSVLVGQVTGADSQVSIGAGESELNALVFYFDKEGNYVEGDSAPEGGGFVVLGLAPGLHTVSVSSPSDPRIISKTALVDDHATHFAPFNFFY